VYDVIAMWRHTKMVVLVALTAAAYVAVLMPFKIVTIIPGFTEIRPGVAIPIVCGMLFGPAAAWGAAFGNLIGDVFGGMLGPGSLFGMIGNFLLAYVPYRMWRALRGDRAADGMPAGLGWFALCSIMGGFACAVTIGFGVGALNLVPIPVLTPTIAGNNAVFGTIVAAILLPLLYPRAKQWGLVYSDIMDAADYRGGPAGWPGLVLTVVGSVVGVLLAIDYIPAAAGKAGAPYINVLPSSASLVYASGVCFALILIGVLLMSPLGRSFGLTRAWDHEDKTDAPAEADQEGKE